MSDEGNEVVDFNKVRADRLEEKRRRTERIFFQKILGIYSVAQRGAMRPIEILDVSEDGLSFITPFDSKDPWPNDMTEMPLRLYFTQDTYVPVHVRVQNSRPMIQNGMRYIRYGCKVDTSLQSYEVYQQFVKFLKCFAEQAHKEEGSVTHFYL